MSMLVRLASRAYLASALPAWRRFDGATRDPASAQRAVLTRILDANRDTVYGRRFRFADIRGAAEFRARLPVIDYEAMARDIDVVAGGAPQHLTTQPVTCFELTGGTSGANKLIPYTRGLLREFSAATLPWTFDLLRHRPALRNGRAYWAITPPARGRKETSARIPIGLDHDVDYFPRFAQGLLDRLIATPRVLSRATDVEGWRYLTLLSLLAVEDLCFISVWSPSFLTLLADALRRGFDRLIGDLETGTISTSLSPALRAVFERALPARPRLARDFRRAFGRTAPDDLALLWPRLSLISCWTEGSASLALPAMRRHFPRVDIQGKGLLATEGVVSVPMHDASGAVAAVTSHYLEFLALDDRSADALGVHELETGVCYEVLITTSGGLYRYRLRDIVRVEGWFRRTPVLSFQGRTDHTTDLAGEKLSLSFVERVLREASAATCIRPLFAMLTPRAANGTRARYDLLVECDVADAERFARAVDAGLAESHHYALCRRLGQLDAVCPMVVRGAQSAYERWCLARGQRFSAVKPPALDARCTALDLIRSDVP